MSATMFGDIGVPRSKTASPWSSRAQYLMGGVALAVVLAAAVLSKWPEIRPDRHVQPAPPLRSVSIPSETNSFVAPVAGTSSNSIISASSNWTTASSIVVSGTGVVTTMLGASSAEPETVLPVPPKVVASPQFTTVSANDLARYHATADTVGVAPSDMLVEEFRQFLAAQHVMVYETSKVVAYMDAVARRDNPTRYGWHWAPVRAKDVVKGMAFGQPSQQGWSRWVQTDHGVVTQDQQTHAASDFYDARTAVAYAKTIPLHALEKIALIEKRFGAGKVAFLVSDYTESPDSVRPDPFLMAVVISSETLHGQGRFVIDAWDEPGFGVVDATANKDETP